MVPLFLTQQLFSSLKISPSNIFFSFTEPEKRRNRSKVSWQREERVVHALLLPGWYERFLFVIPFFPLSIDRDEFCGPRDEDDLVNDSSFYWNHRYNIIAVFFSVPIHSCDGNTWYDGPDKIVACRDIKAGEQVPCSCLLILLLTCSSATTMLWPRPRSLTSMYVYIYFPSIRFWLDRVLACVAVPLAEGNCCTLTTSSPSSSTAYLLF